MSVVWGFRGVEDAWDSVSWKPRLLGLREEGSRVRTSGSLERRDAGVVCRMELLLTPKPPQGPLVHLASVPLSSVMRRTLTRESQSQKALEPHRGELESPPKREPNPPVHSQKQSLPRYLQTLRKKNVSFYKSQFGHGLLHNITTASTD